MRKRLLALVVGLCLLGILLVPRVAVTASETPATVCYRLPTANLVINGVAVDSEGPPVIIDGVAYVPIWLVAESSGNRVDWDQGTLTVRVGTGADGSYWVPEFSDGNVLWPWGYWITVLGS